MHELKADFFEMVSDVALEYELDLPKDFIEELFSQSLNILGDCQENVEE